jgi:hypothetical protein
MLCFCFLQAWAIQGHWQHCGQDEEKQKHTTENLKDEQHEPN